jgi:hypothetical protein
MNTFKRWSFGLLSTCFLAVGLVRAADMLDPVNRELRAAGSSVVSSPTPDCVSMCYVVDQPAPDCVSMCYIADKPNASDLN